MAGSIGRTAFEARKLLRATRLATLATVADGGQPFASLVTPACAPDLSLLLLLSDLSEHTRHLRAEPRCSVLVCGEAEGVNPQTVPRVTVTGIAEIADDEALKARFIAVHPYASMYADFGDFHLWRIRPMAALFVGGFARASRLRQTDLVPPSAAVAVIAAAEIGILERCNNDRPDGLSAIAGNAADWRLISTDVDGMDLAAGERVLRIHWSQPMADGDSVRSELVRMTREAKDRAACGA